MDYQIELHKLSLSEIEYERQLAALLLGMGFAQLPIKKKACDDIHRLTFDKSDFVRSKSVHALCNLIYCIGNKQKIWDAFQRLIEDESEFVREHVAKAMGFSDFYGFDKEQAWNNLSQLAKDKDGGVRMEAAASIGLSFANIPNKEQAWNCLLRLVSDEVLNVQMKAADALGLALANIPNIEQAWKDIPFFIEDDKNMRVTYAVFLNSAFSNVPSKEQSWVDLHLLTKDGDRYVRYHATIALASAFPKIANKDQALRDIYRLIKDEYSYTREYAACALGLAFQNAPDKEQVWQELKKLIHDKDDAIRGMIVLALGHNFKYIPDKKQAWQDLIMLKKDKSYSVQQAAASSIGMAFNYSQDKEQIWQDLHMLTKDNLSYMRDRVAYVIGSTFPALPEKEQAWEDLIKLSNDKENNVKVSAYYSLGKVSTFKAIQAKSEQQFRIELEKSIRFFEMSSKHVETNYNPTKFCLPFYRSFYAITFNKHEVKGEIKKYLIEARRAIGDSYTKNILLKTIENLANALEGYQKLEIIDFVSMKYDLSIYKRYCEQAIELTKITKENAPIATMCLEKGLPILNERIEELINEINKEVCILNESASGTEAEKYANIAYEEVGEFFKIRNPIELEKRIAGFIQNLKFLAEILPEIEKKIVYSKLKNFEDEEYLEDKLVLITDIIIFITPYINIKKKLDDLTISLKQGIHEELVITVGANAFGTGMQHIIHIPLQEINYPNLKKDIEKISGKAVLKLTDLPARFHEIFKNYLIRNDMHEILKYLS